MGKKLYRYENKLFESLADAQDYVRSVLDCPSEDQLHRFAQIKDGTYYVHPSSPNLPREFSLREKMPPVYDQGTRGTCVANAATALVEYYNDNKWRFSVQFLFEMMKQRELEVRNKAVAEIRAGLSPSDPIMAKRAKVASLSLARRRSIDARQKAFASGKPGEVDSFYKAVTPDDIASVIMSMEITREGSLLNRAFEVLQTKGICMEKYWPYARTQVASRTVVDGFDVSSLPPGAEENAKMHMIPSGLYLLRHPNNIEELKRLLSGFDGKRPMPVCIGVDVHGGMQVTDGVVDMPEIGEAEIYEEEYEARFTNRELTEYVVGDPIPGTMTTASKVPAFVGGSGGHEVILVGYRDDPNLPGGGAFEMRNSWDVSWGNGGYAWLPYAYVEIFCDEAGTIVQSMVDYKGDGYGGATAQADVACGVSDIPEELKPYLQIADRDMKNSRGIWQIGKGARVIVDEDGIAELDTPLNRKRFAERSYSWRGEVSNGEPSNSSKCVSAHSAGRQERGKFVSGIETAFRRLPIEFPLFGGVKKPGILSSPAKATEFKQVADLSAQLGDTLIVYDVRGRKNLFRIAVAWLSSAIDAGEKAERVRQLVGDYSASRRFDPCDCTITVVGAEGPIADVVQPYISDSDVRLVVDSYQPTIGWRVCVSEKDEDGYWHEWIKRLVPNMPEQWSARFVAAWQEIGDSRGHVTLAKMSERLNMPSDVVAAMAEQYMRGYKVKSGNIVKE